jgi:hypothetical protein
LIIAMILARVDLQVAAGRVGRDVVGFNRQRLLEPNANIPPAEAEERYNAMLNEQKLAA